MFNKSNIIILSTLIITFVALFFASQLTVYHDLEAFFPHTDTDLDFYEVHRARFESDDNFILIAPVRKAGIFDSSFLQQVTQLTQALDTVSNTVNIASLTNFKEAMYTSFGPVTIPILHVDDPSRYRDDSIKIFQDKRLVNKFISADATTLSIIVKHDSELGEKELSVLNESVKKILSHFQFESLHTAGRPETVAAIIESISSEFVFYAAWSTLLTLVVIWLLFRRLAGVALALISVLLGLCWFMGFLGFVGRPLDLMSPLFPTLMIVVGMSDVVHIFSKYLDEINKGNSQRKALRIAINEIGLATLLTSFTTAVGFASLYTGNIVAIKNFGIYAAIGVLMAYVVVIFFTTACMSKIVPQRLASLRQHSGFWDKWMEKCYVLVRDNQKIIALSGILVFLWCIWGISQINTNTVMLDDLPRNSRVRSDFHFFEDKMSGVRAFEVAVTAQKGHKINDLAVLQEIERFENYLATIPEIGTIYSPTTIYKSLHKANNGNALTAYQLPEKAKALKKYERQLKKAGRQSEAFNLLMTEDRKYGRINGNMKDLGSDKITVLNAKINGWITQNLNSKLAEFRITGTGLLVDKNHHYLRKSLFGGLGLAFLVVSLMMALLFRDIKMVFISLIPNVFPLLITGAIMGFAGIPLKASTSIIFTIAFGIAVDDTIHFLSKFKLQLNKGDTIDQAIRTTFLEAGKAICLTTLILVTGFIILATSDFKATSYVGLLVSITLFSALFADLFLLPVCIYQFIDKKEK